MDPKHGKGTGDERPNFAPGSKPFTKYKIVELCLCGAAVILGLLYLYTKTVPLGVLLPLYAAIFWAIVPLRWKDAKTTGATGWLAFLSVVLWAVMALLVTAAAVVYFIWY